MSFLVRSAAALVILLLGCADARPRPNVLLVSIDTLRADHVSAYGYARATTPRIDALAAQGMRFERAYSPTASTGPSHATLFTGQYPISHRLDRNGLPLAEEHETLAEVLAGHGYHTGAVVSSFVLDPKFGFGQGFETYDADFHDAVSVEREWEGHHVARFDRRAEETSEVAMRWLAEARNAGRPFFLFVHYFDPHSPYLPPGEYGLRFTERGTPPGSLEHKIQLYDGEVAYVDAQLGRLLDALDAEGLADETIVLLTADHGEGLGDHGVLLHAIYVYEEAVRVPLVVRWPGRIEPGRHVAGPVALVDVAPTLLELLGIDRGDLPLQGRSFAAALTGTAALDPERPVFLQRRPYRSGTIGGVRVKGERYAVLVGPWKLIVGTGLGSRELYQLTDDPGELDDRYYDEPRVAKPLAARIENWHETYWRERPESTVSEEDRRALEALGYVD